MKRLTLFLVVGFAAFGWAQETTEWPPKIAIPDDLTFGFEPTVASEAMLESEGNYTVYANEQDAKRAAIVTALAKELPGSTPFNVPAYKVSYNGRIFDIGTNPGCIEVRPPPQTLETIPVEMGAVFRAFEKVGVEVEYFWGGAGGGGGHIHVDKGPFEKNPMLLRNLLVDVYNRPYLNVVLNELGDTTKSDNAITVRDKGVETNFLNRIRQLDTLPSYTFTDVISVWNVVVGNDRYVEINLTNLPNGSPATVEFRAIRGQNTAQDCYDQALLLHRYLKMLNAKRTPVALKKYSAVELKLMRTPSGARQHWRKFVQNLGLDPDRYDRFVSTKFPSPLRRGSVGGKQGLEVRLMDFAYLTYEYEIKVNNPSQVSKVLVDGQAVPLHSFTENGVRRLIGTFKIVHSADGFTTPDIRAFNAKGKKIPQLSGPWDLAPNGDPVWIWRRPAYLPRARLVLTEDGKPRSPPALELVAGRQGKRYTKLTVRNHAPEKIGRILINGIDVFFAGSSKKTATLQLPKDVVASSAFEIRAFDREGREIGAMRGLWDLHRGVYNRPFAWVHLQDGPNSATGRTEYHLLVFDGGEQQATEVFFALDRQGPARIGSVMIDGRTLPMNQHSTRVLLPLMPPAQRTGLVIIGVSDESGQPMKSLFGILDYNREIFTNVLGEVTMLDGIGTGRKAYFSLDRSIADRQLEFWVYSKRIVAQVGVASGIARLNVDGQEIPIRFAQEESRTKIVFDRPPAARPSGVVEIRALDQAGAELPLFSGRLDVKGKTFVRSTGEAIPVWVGKGQETHPTASQRPAASPPRGSLVTRVKEWFTGRFGKPVPSTERYKYARPGRDLKLDAALKFIASVPTGSERAGAIVKAIRAGKISVYWVNDWNRFDPKGSGALSNGHVLYLNPKHSHEMLVMEIVHEGTHAEGTVRTGRSAREADAFLTELEFAEAVEKAKGIKLPRTLGKLSYEQARRLSPGELETLIQLRWPALYGGKRALGHRGMWAKVKESAGKTARGAMGMGFFAGGFLLKETVQGITQKDYGRIKKAVKEMGTPGFLGGFAVFAGAQHVVEKGVKVAGMKGGLASVTKFALPLYAAVGIMHAVSGKSTPLDAASDATSFGAMMLAMMPADMALRAALYPALIAAGPAGWAGIAAIEITKAAILLWGSEKIQPYVKEALKAIGKTATQAGKTVVEGTKQAASWAKGQAQSAVSRLANAFSWTTRRLPLFGWGGLGG